MSATLIQLADTIAATIASQTWILPVVVQRAYQPIHTLADTRQAVRVNVVPASVVHEYYSRAQTKVSYTVQIGILHRPTPMSQTELDKLMQLTESMLAYFRGKRLPPTNYYCVRMAYEPLYASEHMDEYRQFTAVISLTFRAEEFHA